MIACVADASVVARWWCRETDTSRPDGAISLLRALKAGTLSIHVPDLLPIEVGNAMWKLVRFGGWNIASARAALGQLQEIPLTVHHVTVELVGTAFDVASSHGITVYDAMYVCLAARLDLPLLTADDRLVRKIGPSFPFVRSIV